MSYTTLISTAALAAHLADPDWAVVDCRFWLADTERGRRDYQQAHIPGAIYAHLDADLSGKVIPGKTGRHPLPEVEAITRTLSNGGIASGVQVVAYDDTGGSMAARLWWLLRWLGHEAVAVLDGGWPAWQGESRSACSGVESRPPRSFVAHLQPQLAASTAEVLSSLHHEDHLVLDSRAADRYRGENETIDPVAGHIPGAICAPYADNLGPDGRFRSPEALRARFQPLLGDLPAERAIFYCGSGVTAAHNILATMHAGLGGEARLYVGSWSEWITDPARPVKTSTER
ncbi:MAG TPA: sulfurtransferase [Anaerolineae bacterium]